MNKFRKHGVIDYSGGLEVHSSLMNVLRHEAFGLKVGEYELVTLGGFRSRFRGS